MVKKIILLVGVAFGLFLIVALAHLTEAKVEVPNHGEVIEMVSCSDDLDSISLLEKQDSVIRYGNKRCSDALFYYYIHKDCGVYDNAYYSLIMVNKYRDKESFGRLFPYSFDKLKEIKQTGILGRIMTYYVLQGVEVNDENSCELLVMLSENGFLFPYKYLVNAKNKNYE